jgi:hypothetical protein
MLRWILVSVLVSAVIWVVAIITLVGLIYFGPQEGPWVHRTFDAWLVGVLIMTIGGVVIRIRMSRRSS